AVQANKAGLLEIADVFAINKADRPGTADTRRDLDRMLDLTVGNRWRPPIVETVASTGEGVDELWEVVRAHRAHLEEAGALAERRRRRVATELVEIMAALVRERAEGVAAGRLVAIAGDVEARTIDPWTAAEHLL